MTSEHAPPTIPSVETGTPPKEWSESLLKSRARDTPITSSDSAKVGPVVTEQTRREELQVPKEPGNQEALTGDEAKQTTRDQSSISETVMQTVKQYVPEPVGKAVDYAAQTAAAAASYLPDTQGTKDTVASYLSSGERPKNQHVSLPSTELKGALPAERTGGGVGALPGNLSESSVALLPDERQERLQEQRPATPLQSIDTIKPTAESGGDEPRNFEKEVKTTQDIMPSKDEPDASHPSDAVPQSTEASAGESVTTDTVIGEVRSQREAGKSESQQLQVGQAAAGAVGMTGIAPGDEAAEKQKAVSELISEKPSEGRGPSQETQEGASKEEGTTAPKEAKAGYSGEYHPAELHPPPPGASAAEYKSTHGLGAQQESPELATTEMSRRASVGGEKKPGFVTMVKGEMKILAGKISGNEYKVEEGKKIVHGEA